jgi:hypothetical protein
MINTWALVLWIGVTSNHTIHEQFTSKEKCLESQRTMANALASVNSKVNAVCRPIQR